jgi:hypothetical protein
MTTLGVAQIMLAVTMERVRFNHAALCMQLKIRLTVRKLVLRTLELSVGLE